MQVFKINMRKETLYLRRDSLNIYQISQMVVLEQMKISLNFGETTCLIRNIFRIWWNILGEFGLNKLHILVTVTVFTKINVQLNILSENRRRPPVTYIKMKLTEWITIIQFQNIIFPFKEDLYTFKTHFRYKYKVNSKCRLISRFEFLKIFTARLDKLGKASSL